MEHSSVAIFVAIAPAIATAVAGFVVEVVPVISQAVKKLASSTEKVEWVKEFVSHASFYGTAAAGFFGYTKESAVTGVAAVLWFLICLRVSYALACQLEELEEAKEELKKIRFRKIAGMTRAIIREEMARTTMTKSGGKRRD